VFDLRDFTTRKEKPFAKNPIGAIERGKSDAGYKCRIRALIDEARRKSFLLS
jgi:hypothetical protein